ncbi:glutaredoxin 3 [Sphingomonas arantia]|uniref:Glutaredoxin n=1 Tax=Sphingomonas arantia TaxID=1460676 RepID=A0ABW4TYJ8_9SPHN
MAKVEIYTKATCPYCQRAKKLLDSKGVKYHETDVLREPAERDTMIQRAGGKSTVPQIFIDGKHVGGSDDLAAFDRGGKLDALLAA